MPGIVGLITKMPREWAQPQLERMVKPLCHEADYTVGTWVDEVQGIYVGWTVRKNSFADGMPLHNEKGDVCLIFSGEEFSDPGTALRLRERGHSLEVDGPSYLLHLYEESPEAFLSRLNGKFHGLLIDRTQGTTTIFNDRYGMHRLYYHDSKEAFYFSAEAKAILAVRPELRTIDPRGLGEFISCGCVLENRSLFNNIYVLPPSSAWDFREGSLARKDLYFDPKEWEEQDPLEPESYYQELRKVFSQILPRYLTGTQRIGVSLTGGLDSRIIMAWWKAQPGSVPCYTFRGMYHACQDLLISQQVAKVCEQPHQEILVGQEFLSHFPEFAERSIYLTDACVDVSRSPVLYVNERVAKIAPVRMTGNYGSEILRRMIAFKPSEPSTGLFNEGLLPHIRRARETYRGFLPGHPVSFIAFRQVPWHHWGLLALEQSQLSPRSPYLDNDLVRTAFRVPNPSFAKGTILVDNDDCLRLIGDGNAALRGLPTDRGLGEPPGVRGALTRAFLEVTFKAEYEYDYGMPQWLAQIDRVLSSLHLERLFLGRHKYYHFRVWYRDALSKYVKEMLLDPRTLSRPFIERRSLEAIVHDHVKGNRNYTTEIHKVLTLELLYRLFIDPR
jgi:asparagine synthase (glutamine-hydrolysing)